MAGECLARSGAFQGGAQGYVPAMRGSGVKYFTPWGPLIR